MTELAALAIIAGMMLVRLGWGWGWRTNVAILGWAVVAAGLLADALASGAWGLAIGTTVAMLTALAALLASGWAMPGRAWRPARERVAAAQAPRPARLMRRVSVFLLVVPAGGVAALALAFGAQAAARRAGVGAADAAACLLLLSPALWTGLMTWQMTREGPRRMIAPPLLAAALGSILWAAR